MKRLFPVAFLATAALLLLAGGLDAASKKKVPAKPKEMQLAQAAPVLTVGNPNIIYLANLAQVGITRDSDTTFWCDTPSGCGPGVDLKRITAPQISSYVLSKIIASPPLSFNGSALQLGYDSTLAVIGGQLHVQGGSGTGFPFVLGGTSINAGSTNTMISNLTLGSPTLAGNVAGSPNYTGVPLFTALNTGTPVFCLALDSGNNLIKVPAVSGSCAGGGGGGSFLLADTGSHLLVDTGVSFLVQ